jgi:chromatin remodeling complex protein RSC6
MALQKRILKGPFGAKLSDVEFGRQRGIWMERNFVKSAAISLKVSFPLREVIGNQQVYSESQVISKVWNYINKNNLGDHSDERSIIPDRKLGKILGKGGKKFRKSKVAIAIKKHIRK